MQALANQMRGAASIGVAMGLDVVYVETCAYLRGTLARPDVGALRSVASTAMDADPISREAFDKQWHEDIATWARVVQASGAKPD